MTITTFTHMDNFYNKLYSLQDLKYKEFHQKLIKKEIITNMTEIPSKRV